MAQAYRVTAPYVTVRVSSQTGGETVLGFYEGGVLSESALKESIDSLLAKGMIEKTDLLTPEQQAREVAKVADKAAAAAEKAEEKAADAKPVPKG